MFTDSQISEELMEKIVAFVDREAGRDAPLTARDEAMVRDLLERDAEACQIADDLRATNAGLDTLLDDVAAVEVPDKLVALIRGHGASDVLIAEKPGMPVLYKGDDEQAMVVELGPKTAMPGFGYGGLAAAASIAFFVSCGALLHLYTTFQDDRSRLESSLATASDTAKMSQKDLADASAELKRLRAVTERSADERALAARELAEKGDVIARLEIEQTTLKGRFDDLISENERLSDLIQERTTEAAAVDLERQQLLADLSEVRQALDVERNQTSVTRGALRLQATDLADELAEKERRLVELAGELQDAERQSASNDITIVEMSSEKQGLETRLAALDAEYQALIAERDDAERAVALAEQKAAALESNLVVAESARQAAVGRVARLEADLAASTSWLNQVAQYHRIYASTARRHLVEVGADEQPHIEKWLATVLGRSIPVPDLSDSGVVFQGARLLGVNEKPVAELVYLDSNDQPLAFCIIPSDMGAKEPTTSVNRDLNLVDWRDRDYAYALVGWSDPDLLVSLTRTIRPIYEL